MYHGLVRRAMQEDYVRNRTGHLEPITTSLTPQPGASSSQRDNHYFGLTLFLVGLTCLIATRANLPALSDVTAGLFMLTVVISFLKQKIALTRKTAYFAIGLLVLFAENLLFTVNTFDFKIYIKLFVLCISVIFCVYFCLEI